MKPGPRMTRLSLRRLTLAATVLLAASQCCADTDGLKGILGVGPVWLPRYASGQQQSTRLAPFYFLEWGEWLDVDSFNGATVWVAKAGSIKLGPNLTYTNGIDKAPGLERVSARPTLGARIEWDITPWFDAFAAGGTEVGVPQRGVSANAGAEAVYEYRSRWYGYSAARLNWGNATYQSNYFGVTPGEAAQSGYPTYAPSAGLTGLSVDQYVGFKLAEHWGIVAGVSYLRLLGPSAASPTITLGGRPNQWLYGVFFGYQF